MSNAIEIVLNLETYVDPFPGKADDEVVFVECVRCFGEGHLVGYEFIDGGRCWGCFGHKGANSTVGAERKKEKARVSRRNSELRKTVKRQEAHNERMAAYEAKFPQLSGWWEAMSEDNFLLDLWGKAFDYDLSEKQVAAAAAAMDRRAAWAAQKAEEAIAKAALPPAPVGKVEVTGTVVKVKYHENDFGGAWKMIVEGAEGWKVWATIPAKLWAALEAEQTDENHNTQAEEFVGRRVTFTATLEASDKDKSFAFAKRPSKASIA
jgi:hypothetical protein